MYNMEMIFGVFITSKFSSAFLSVFHILSRMEIPYFTDNPEVFHKSTAPTAIITDFLFIFYSAKQKELST